MEFNTIQEAPPIILNFYDVDDGFMGQNESYMARAIIFLHQIKDLSDDSRIPKPEWYPVKYSFNDFHDPESGAQVLCSFACVEFDHEFLVEADNIEL